MKYLDKFKLKNEIAFVLGGSGTIGKEICIALADAGAKVINIDIKKNELIHQKNNIKFEYFNVKNLKAFEKFLKKIILKHGTPEVFVNCSYPFEKSWSKSSFQQVSLNSIINNTNLHLNSYVWCARVIAEFMKKKKIKGKIIQLASTYGILGQDPQLYKGINLRENAIYSSIKGGIINQTKQMAAYYGQYGIRVNSVSPGGIQGKIAGKKNNQTKKFIKRYSNKTPLKRMGKPIDIAPTIIFLASEASSYITGSNIIVDGGWTIV
jgi:NAD(P)-dependent dehydrogenase (short-subunit alcohol dehydrogenase family)